MQEQRRSRRAFSRWRDSRWPEGEQMSPARRRALQMSEVTNHCSGIEDMFLRRYAERVAVLGGSIQAVRDTVMQQLRGLQRA